MCYLFDWKDSYSTEERYDPKSKVKVYAKLFTDPCYKRAWRLVAWSVQKSPENLDSKIFKTKNGIPLNSELQSQNLWKNKNQKDYWVI